MGQNLMPRNHLDPGECTEKNEPDGAIGPGRRCEIADQAIYFGGIRLRFKKRPVTVWRLCPTPAYGVSAILSPFLTLSMRISRLQTV